MPYAMRRRLFLPVLALLFACESGGSAEDCREWRLQAFVPEDIEVTIDTRAATDIKALDQASWTVLNAPDQPPTKAPAWAADFPVVTFMALPSDAAPSPETPKQLTVVVSDGCR